MAGFLNTIILLATLQGFILFLLLLRTKVNRLPNRFLAFLILCMSLCSLNLYLMNVDFTDNAPAWVNIAAYFIPLVIVMPMGPLLYFYTRTMLDPSFRLTRLHRLQFYTAIIDIGPELTTIIFVCGIWFGLIIPGKQVAGQWGLFIDYYNVYADIPRWLSLTIYLCLSYQYLQKEKKSVNGIEKHERFKWLKQFLTVLLVFQIIWLAYLIPYVTPGYTWKMSEDIGWFPIYIPMAIMIYWLGIKGYIISYSAEQRKKKAVGSDLPDVTIQQTSLQLTRSMEEDKLYLNPGLSLDLVAVHTGIPAKTISAVLNQHHQKSFNEWLNGYRVEEFKQRIRQKEQLEQMTLSAIAFDCGFNSQATFQRIFKQSVGMTPSEYLKTLQLSA